MVTGGATLSVVVGARAPEAAVHTAIGRLEVVDEYALPPAADPLPVVVHGEMDHDVWHLPIAPLASGTRWVAHLMRGAFIGLAMALWLGTTVAMMGDLVWLVVLLGAFASVTTILLGRASGDWVATQARHLAELESYSTEYLRVDALGVTYERQVIGWSELVVSVTELDNCCMIELFGRHEHVLLPVALELEAAQRLLDELGTRRRAALGAMDPVDDEAIMGLRHLVSTTAVMRAR